jgi:hypothetical protein
LYMTHEIPQPPDPQNQQPLQIYERQLDPADPCDAVVAMHEMSMLANALRGHLPDKQRGEEIEEQLRHAEGVFDELKLGAMLDAHYDFASDGYGEQGESRTVETYAGVPNRPETQIAREQAMALYYADELSCASKLLGRLHQFSAPHSAYDIGQVSPYLRDALVGHCRGIYSLAIDVLRQPTPDSVQVKSVVVRRLLGSSDPRDRALAVALERGINRANNADRFEQ